MELPNGLVDIIDALNDVDVLRVYVYVYSRLRNKQISKDTLTVTDCSEVTYEEAMAALKCGNLNLSAMFLCPKKEESPAIASEG